MPNTKTLSKAKATANAAIIADMPQAATNAVAVNAPTPTKSAPAPFVHAHADSGVTGKHYDGLSGYLNANRKPAITLGTTRAASTLTARMLGTLRAMRDAYGTKHFAARGFDNAVCQHLIAAGMLRTIDGSGTQTATFAADGETPLKLSVTASGIKYGKA